MIIFSFMSNNTTMFEFGGRLLEKGKPFNGLKIS